MNVALWVFDVALCITLVVLAVQTLSAAHLFRAIMSFVVFGVVIALALSRLGAPDIAMAEAAIGTGLTAALLLSTLAEMSQSRSDAANDHTDGPS